MEIRITSRSGDDTQESLEVPEDTQGFLQWLAVQGTVAIYPPGAPMKGVWGGRDPVDRFTVHLVDEHD